MLGAQVGIYRSSTELPSATGRKVSILAFDWAKRTFVTPLTPDWTNGEAAEV